MKLQPQPKSKSWRQLRDQLSEQLAYSFRNRLIGQLAKQLDGSLGNFLESEIRCYLRSQIEGRFGQ